MATYRFRHPCPECGSINVRCLMTGATEDEQMVRMRRCDDCRHKFTTIEVLSPVSFYRIDVHRKYRNRMKQREKRGYWGGMGGAQPKRTPLVRVKFTVIEREQKVSEPVRRAA